MLRYTVSTEHLAPSDRFEFWYDMLARPAFDSPDLEVVAALPPVQARTQFADSFHATMHITASNALNLVVTDSDSLDIARTGAMTRRHGSDTFYLAVSYDGCQQLVLDRDLVELRPSDMVLLHGSLPMYSRSDPHVRRQRHAMVVVDSATVPGGAQRLRHLVGRPLSSQDGMVSLVAQHLLLLGTGRFHPGDAEQLASMTSSLLSLMLARVMATEPSMPSETRAEALFARVRSYIVDHLSDPGLDTDSVAVAHHVSTRTLHRLFQTHGLTVAAWIRRLRLERCRAELLNPAFADQPVRTIARRWGFTDPAQFSRVYRDRYDESPSASRTEERELDMGPR